MVCPFARFVSPYTPERAASFALKPQLPAFKAGVYISDVINIYIYILYQITADIKVLKETDPL